MLKFLLLLELSVVLLKIIYILFEDLIITEFRPIHLKF